jgi:hypothetical protein
MKVHNDDIILWRNQIGVQKLTEQVCFPLHIIPRRTCFSLAVAHYVCQHT